MWHRNAAIALQRRLASNEWRTSAANDLYWL